MKDIIKFYQLSSKKLATLSLFLLLIFLIFYAWRFIPEMTITGEGFIWLQSYQHKVFYSGLPTSLFLNNVLAIVIGNLFSRFYGLNMYLYFWTELLTILSISILLFLLVLNVSKKYSIAFISSLMFSVNYLGNFSMVVGLYAYFMERVILLLFLIPSLIFLHLYLENKKIKYYIISIMMYFIVVFASHWSIFFTAPFLFYPILYQLYKDRNYKIVLKSLAIGVSFALISIFFTLTTAENRTPNSYTLVDFFTHPLKYHYPKKMLEQVSFLTISSIDKRYYFSRFPYSNSEPKADYDEARNISPYIFLAYIFILVFTYIRLPKQRAILGTFLITLVSILFLNSYFGFITEMGYGRYLYYPLLPLAILWSLITEALFFKKENHMVLKVIGVLLIIGYYLLNNWLITKNFQLYFDTIKPAKSFLQYLHGDLNISNGSTVIIPENIKNDYLANFLNDQFQNKGINFTLDSEKTDFPKKVEINYNKDCNCFFKSE